jgi:hypothetical protein
MLPSQASRLLPACPAPPASSSSPLPHDTRSCTYFNLSKLPLSVDPPYLDDPISVTNAFFHLRWKRYPSNRPHLSRRAPQQPRGLIHRCALPVPGMQSRSVGIGASVPKSIRPSDISGPAFLCRSEAGDKYALNQKVGGKMSSSASLPCRTFVMLGGETPCGGCCCTEDSGANQRAETVPFRDLSLVV